MLPSSPGWIVFRSNAGWVHPHELLTSRIVKGRSVLFVNLN
ncbi:MAG: hypothetical protein RRZ66_04615 [Bacteroidales bacterium]